MDPARLGGRSSGGRQVEPGPALVLRGASGRLWKTRCVLTNGIFQFSLDFLGEGLVTVGVRWDREAQRDKVLLANGSGGSRRAAPF